MPMPVLRSSRTFVRTIALRQASSVRYYSIPPRSVNDADAPEPNIELKLPENFPPLSPDARKFLSRLIRVDQAGELGADLIYAGQHWVFKRSRPSLAPLIRHMWDQEIHHHKTFDDLQNRHRIRPSLFSPVWKIAAYGLGMGTALMGKEAAMACTLAVETVIGGHYNNQLRELVRMLEEESRISKDGQASAELQALAKTVSEFRDDELEHLDTAVENDAEKATPYIILTETIKGGCRAAVWIAERF
ncbi:ubiquinone biosynthesis protein COQ7-domain-containing protein [Lipomyces orientalis]|uniref:Ubiquinone biosynthesis protein COQ7-domain-containing protein n=1 Tax=Lipomyces orientalis TaxID=1233043 RepID=A0ACC3TGI5_9ASCO